MEKQTSKKQYGVPIPRSGRGIKMKKPQSVHPFQIDEENAITDRKYKYDPKIIKFMNKKKSEELRLKTKKCRLTW